ncbi:hypothetical protein ACM16X_04925 [Haloarcula japonica]|uniref:hypothetical protein n=1 Tax=Haloarcula japonica TaxID=29282 RepID=UPI0039F7041A
MTTIQFGSKAAADSARNEYSDHLCSEDDRRLKRVKFASDTPDHVLDQARLEAEDSREEDTSGPGQVPLTDAERGRIDFSKGRANVPHARAVKGIAADEGVSDWTAYYDPTLTVDEHREVMERAAREGGGSRQDSRESTAERAARAAQKAKGGQCDHAREHCEHGDPDACEFLTTTCGLSDEEVQALLSDYDEADGQDDQANQAIEGAAAGALKRAWGGYQGATADLAGLLDRFEREWKQAQQAAEAINSIRENHGQESIHFEKLEGAQAKLQDLRRTAAVDCHECHADHDGHGHADHEAVEEARDRLDGLEDPRDQVLDTDDQRTLTGERADDQARLAGGEQGERGQGEVEQAAQVEENPGGLMADQRTDAKRGPTGEGTEQQVPDEFQVAEGGQETL